MIDETEQKMIDELAEYRRKKQEVAWKRRHRCRTCGASDGDLETGYLTEFAVAVAPGEEGHSLVEGYLCERHLAPFLDMTQTLNISVHAHGGICYLEALDCPGHQHMDKCPTPESQYGED